jgi:hypothetical protein
MKIAYVGNFEPEFSTENDVRKAFEYLGHEVIKLQEGDNHNPNKASITDIVNAALDSDLLLWTGTWADAYPLEVVLDLFHECAVKGIPTATLHLDTFWGKSRGGRKWWREPMFHTAYIFTADGDYQKEWELLGKKHIWLPPAVRHDAAHLGKFREEFACDVAFVGSNGHGYHEDVWGYRKELVDNLREMCRRNGWSFKNPGGDDPKIPRGEDMNDFYASAKVTVGDSLCLKKEDSHYWSDRVPEATGRGGFLIMPQIKALMRQGWLIPSYKWGDFEHLERAIEYCLNDPKGYEGCKKINQENTAKHHTYINRAKKILRKVGLNG